MSRKMSLELGIMQNTMNKNPCCWWIRSIVTPSTALAGNAIWSHICILGICKIWPSSLCVNQAKFSIHKPLHF